MGRYVEKIVEAKDNTLNSLEKIVKPIGEVVLKIAAYPLDLAKLAYFKVNRESYCDKIETEKGCYCALSKKFLANKELVRYFCQNGKPDKTRTRSRGLFNSYIGCKR